MRMAKYYDIPGYSNYKISKCGKIKSLITNRILKPRPNRNKGYLQVQLSGRNRAVHRLVLETFIGPCPEGMEACHLNGVKTDNRLENLVWDTRRSNAGDRMIHENLNIRRQALFAVTSQDLASFLGLSVSGIRKRVYSGTLPKPRKYRQRNYWLPSDLVGYLSDDVFM